MWLEQFAGLAHFQLQLVAYVKVVAQLEIYYSS